MVALAILYTRHRKQLLATSRLKAHSRIEAEDAINNVFLSMLMRGNELNITTSVKAYLQNAVKYQNLKVQYHALRAENFRKEYRLVSPISVAPVSRMEQEERNRTLMEALNSLSSQQKRAIELSFLQEMGRKEVAKEMGIEPSTVTKYISEALSRLAESPTLKRIY